MTHRRCLFVLAVSLAAAIACSGPPPPGHPILGTWRVYVYGTQCIEGWEFRADGTTHSSSGSEESLSKYEISEDPLRPGYYRLRDTITTSNGQPDCQGHVTPVGDRSTTYLAPLSKGGFKICFDLRMSNCVGEMVRASKPAS
jgi:hypothetical protein